jgi:hypothetical protein
MKERVREESTIHDSHSFRSMLILDIEEIPNDPASGTPRTF